ncbi:MAG: organoarsenical effux MFS transporter ArsJ [Rhodobacteraceae bacterium]|nr:organoarsenical effux MFS transporter ArsJ [Paracoccaceae bacterium]MYE37607.1 organoarsenical effux MFS transporter ArsJ [Paracoccaceae bacterium]
MSELKHLHTYVVVSVGYGAFMFTDGVVRMILLLHFHTLDFTPVQLAMIFLMYELVSMITNLFSGWVGAKFGMARTLYGGLIIQIIALSILAQMNPDWSIAASLVFIMVLQGMSGAARNLTTTTSKSSLKIITDNQEGALFKWAARLTGSKNFIRGAGFLSGALLLGLLGFSTSLILIAGFLAVVTVGVVIVGISNLPMGEKSIRLREVFSKNENVNSLAMARMFLYGARDVWFVVGFPIYLFEVISDGSLAGDMRACLLVGLFTGVWIVVYGMIQTFSPNFVKYDNLPVLTLVQYLKNWGRGIPAILFILGGLTFLEHMNFNWIPATLILGLFIIGYIFAISSSIHSFLILAFSQSSRITLDVGYYYMANSGGRVIGTFLSGLSFQLGGISLCLFTASAMAVLAWFASLRIKPVPAS